MRIKPDIEGFILVGGESRRMGTDKSLLRLEGTNFVERISRALGSITDTITLVGTSDVRASWPVHPVISDVHVKWGALGGLHAALEACHREWAAVVACDLPFVTGDLFERLVTLRDGFAAVVPVQVDGRRQPLCALYRVAECRDHAERLIGLGERRPRALLDAIRTRFVGYEELSDLQGADRFFFNVNTPDDFAEAKTRQSN